MTWNDTLCLIQENDKNDGRQKLTTSDLITPLQKRKIPTVSKAIERQSTNEKPQLLVNYEYNFKHFLHFQLLR